MKKNNNSSGYIPVIVAMSVVIGILVGSFYANHFSGSRLSIINNSNNKIGDLLHIIEDQYVDTVNLNEIIDFSLTSILKDLDPHSTYTPAKEVEAQTQDLKGGFSGIGVQFIIYQDTLRVVKIVEGGPAEIAGMQPGDKILKVDGRTFTGPDLTNEKALSTLKGADRSVVKLEVLQSSAKTPRLFTVVRGNVPIKSIDATYMIDKTTGYISINTFAENTYAELLAALAKLNNEGFKSLIIDLQYNTGGYLQTAVQIANEFLPKNKLIVYMEGRKFPRDEYRSDGRGTYQSIPLVILINEFSASSSEILAGAIQDNDRGTIVGRRSFGKGLVQEPIEFSDGSLIRLTVARYYAPSGRCVQKPYVVGDEEAYEMDFANRLTSGEAFSKDSIKSAGEEYKTAMGRIVYGGGGITPDVFVPIDTLDYTSYYQEAVYKGLFYKFAYVFIDANREAIYSHSTAEALTKYLEKQKLVDKFASFAAREGLTQRNLMIRKSWKLIEAQIMSNILDDVFGREASVMYLNRSNTMIKAAVGVIERNEAFPTLHQSTPAKTKPVKKK